MDPGPLSVKMVSSGPVMAKNVLSKLSYQKFVLRTKYNRPIQSGTPGPNIS